MLGGPYVCMDGHACPSRGFRADIGMRLDAGVYFTDMAFGCMLVWIWLCMASISRGCSSQKQAPRMRQWADWTLGGLSSNPKCRGAGPHSPWVQRAVEIASGTGALNGRGGVSEDDHTACEGGGRLLEKLRAGFCPQPNGRGYGYQTHRVASPPGVL